MFLTESKTRKWHFVLSDLSAQNWWNILCCASFLLNDPLPSTPLLTHDLDLMGQSTLPYHLLLNIGIGCKEHPANSILSTSKSKYDEVFTIQLQN